MSPNTLIREKIKEKIVDREMLTELSEKVEEQAQVVVHILYPAQAVPYAIRIWKCASLYSRSSTHCSKLLHADNINIAPNWTDIDGQTPYYFTLFFEGFPKDVLIFDLHEKINEPGGFFFPSIVRNELDIYWIRGNSISAK